MMAVFLRFLIVLGLFNTLEAHPVRSPRKRLAAKNPRRVRVPKRQAIKTTPASQTKDANDPFRDISDEQLGSLMKTCVKIIQDLHVSNKKYTVSKMVHGMLNGMLYYSDAHSNYLLPSEFQRLISCLGGEGVGIGLEAVPNPEGGWLVVAVTEDMPAFKAGIQKNDVITAVDGKSLFGLKPWEFNMPFGKIGTQVELLLRRKGEDKPLLKILKQTLFPSSVQGHAEKEVAYIRISTFDAKTATEVEKVKKNLDEKIGPALKGYVLDLRNNRGGLIDQAVSVANMFIDEGPISFTMGHTNSALHSAIPGRKIFKDLPVVVLIDATSMSSSEILAAALQDHKKAVILGEQSFGKGCGQAMVNLANGDGVNYGGINITTMRFYSPNGNPIQGYGVTPDVRVPQRKPLPEEAIKPLRECNYPNALSKESLDGRVPFPFFSASEAIPDAQKDAGKDPTNAKDSIPGKNPEKKEDFQLLQAIEQVHSLHGAGDFAHPKGGPKEKPHWKTLGELFEHRRVLNASAHSDSENSYKTLTKKSVAPNQ